MNNYFQGLRALESGDYPRAVGLFTRALALDPADADSRVERGFAHLASGDFVQALNDCQAVLRLDPAHERGSELRQRLNGHAHELANPAPADETLSAGDPAPAGSPAEALATVVYETPLARILPQKLPAVETTPEPISLPPVESAAAGEPAAAAAELPEPADYALAEVPGGQQPASSAGPLDEPEPATGQPAASGQRAASDQPPGEATVELAVAHRWTLRSAWAIGRAGLASAAVHAAALLALALVVVHVKARSEQLLVVATTMPASAGRDQPYVFAESQGHDVNAPLAAVGATMVSARLSSAPRLDQPPDIEPGAIGTSQLAVVDRGIGTEITTDLLREYQPKETTELASLRSAEGRHAAALARGGTPQSEAAVERALVWLVRHQNYDGSWNFDHRSCGDCRGKCGNPGNLPQARVGATAMALLPFLGAGHTHIIDKYAGGSKYAKNVQAGLRFLVRSMRVDGGMNEPTGRMYDHGLASIVLCEAYAMTLDRMLLKPAERSLGFIVIAQDPVGGGWRYEPQMAGDTSVVGWQLMAIKSGQMAYLRVPQATIDGASRFLDSVAQDEGAGYGYVDSERGTDATSAVGLLCRMYLGWKRENPALTRGVQKLSALEPSTSGMYFNYYATQVMHHYEGPLWEKWNTSMREYLVRSQSERGHETGSWFFDGDRHNAIGGRLYCTCLAAMTLEVYYRHMPLYSKRAVLDKLGGK